jgi:hypothetical protein
LGKDCEICCTVDEATMEKLNEAAILVEAISPLAWSAVRRFTGNIVLRQDGRSPPTFRSASSAAAIGRCVLVNVASPSTSPVEVAEGIVHEAVHALTSCAELQEPLFRPVEGEDEHTVSSPWTGASLHEHAFLHACLVWFAIQRFWEAALTARILTGHASRRVDEIRDGFKRLDRSAWHSATPAAQQLFIDIKRRAI